MDKNVKMTADEFNLLTRTEHSLDALYEWLEKCVGESDGPLREIIKGKIRSLMDKLNNLLNK